MNINRYAAIFLILAFVFGCCNHNKLVSRQQSLVVSLTVECKHGDHDSCNRLDEEVQKLEILLEE